MSLVFVSFVFQLCVILSFLMSYDLIICLVQHTYTSVSYPFFSAKYPGDEFVRRLLFNWHVLQHLDVEQCLDDNVTIFTVKAPSLRFAMLHKSSDRYIDDKYEFVIDAPLEMLDVYNACRFCTIENMPNIAKATIFVTHCASGILSDITSVKRLYLGSSHTQK